MRSANLIVNDSGPLESSAKAGRTRSAILAAAEQIFARSGYAATRLEDVAEVVGLTRAALFYHFRDKEALYHAMIEDAFGSLATPLDEALSASGSIAQRIERAAEAWVDAVTGRPNIARLILRFVADAEERPSQRIYASSERIRRKYWELFLQGRASGELKPLHDNPIHVASAVVGHTVFYVCALASLIPLGNFKLLAPEQVAAHKRDVLHSVRRQLGITAGPRARPSGGPLESSAKAGRTRSAILAAAEQIFARSGYAATRLEDVAEVVGLTRAALFYHFRDKEALYHAMIEDAFGSLATPLDEVLSDEAFSASGPIVQRIEWAAEAWVDAVAGRPSIARLILRFVADAEERPSQRIYASSERIRRKYWELFLQGRASGELNPLHDNPIHAASAVVGHTVFYVCALASLIPLGDFNLLAPEQVAAHKRDVLHSVRRQLGLTNGRRARQAD